MSDLDPDATVYRHSRPRAGGSLPVVHTDRECRYLERSRRVHSYEWGMLHDDTPICQHCRGAYEAHSPGSAGPWQALEAMDADDLVTDGGQDARVENVSHHVTDDPWCDWCDEKFEEGQTGVALTWEFPSSTMIVSFCSDRCATEWDCSKSRKDRQDVIYHVK